MALDLSWPISLHFSLMESGPVKPDLNFEHLTATAVFFITQMEENMRIMSQSPNASLYQIRDGTKELLGQIPLEKHKHNYVVRISDYILMKAASDTFYLKLPRSFVRKNHGIPLQICHERFVYDVFVNWHIIYALPIIMTCERRINHGNT